MNCIYSISSQYPEIDKTYIGYAKSLKARKAVHTTRCKKNTQFELYTYMNKHGIENFDFNVLIELPSYDRLLLRQLERHYYNLYKPELNKHVPLRSNKTYIEENKGRIQNHRLKNREKNNMLCKENNAKNKEVICKRAREYYRANREKILEKGASVKQCVCGAPVKFYAYKKHLKSNEHKINLNSALCHTIENKFRSLNVQ